MFHLGILFSFAPLALATFTITDPSDGIPSAAWAADNAIIADYNVQPVMYQFIPTVGPYTFNHQHATIDHKTLYVDANDTSVLVVANQSDVTATYTNIIKFGYGSNLLQSSFFGINAAVNVANDSIVHLSHVNITTHNGAANLYSYGTGSVAYVENAWLYSSGPVSHGLYGGGNGTVYGKNIQHYSGGNRCSSFSGDNPAGYIHIENAVAHTDGIGSAICYALGLCNMTNVIGHASRSPVMFSDGAQTGIWTNCDVTAGLLAGVVIFSSQTILSGASVTFQDSKLTVLGSTMPALWFGNVIATANIRATTINNTASNILAVANYSQVTQDFDYFAGYVDNPSLSPASATINIDESTVSGAVVAYNRSSIQLNLGSHSQWTGLPSCANGNCTLGISLDKTSTWVLAGTNSKNKVVVLQNFTNDDPSLSNVVSNGFTIKYNASSAVNKSWKGKTYQLKGGGVLVPV